MNGAEREVISVRYLSPAGPLYIGEPDLKEWGIAPEKLSLQSFSGARWLCVEGLGLNYRLDPAKLTLALDFPPELFGGSRESFVLEDRVPVTYAPGGFLNYDLRFDRTEGVSRSAPTGRSGRLPGRGSSPPASSAATAAAARSASTPRSGATTRNASRALLRATRSRAPAATAHRCAWAACSTSAISQTRRC